MAEVIDTRTLRISPEIFLGPYVDHRKGTGAVLVVRNELVHLDRRMAQQMAEYLLECLREPPIEILPATVLKAAAK